MSMTLAEYVASWSTSIAGLLGDGWTAQPEAGTVASDRVTIDLAEYTITFRSNRDSGGTSSVRVDSGATLGTYVTLARALHNMTDDSARVELHRLTRELARLSDSIDHWERMHNKP